MLLLSIKQEVDDRTDSDIGDDNYDDDDVDDDDDDDDVGSMTEKTPVLSSEKRSKVEIWIRAV